MRDLNWWAILGFGLVGLAMILGITAVWINDPTLASKLGNTAPILGFPGFIILMVLGVKALDSDW